jgi:putative hydrolase of the HAD superfamily
LTLVASIPSASPRFDAVIDTWLFDLDNTLYPAASNLFAQISRRMGWYVAKTLGVPEDRAKEVQKLYFREHGTTLSGLMKLHHIDPDDFLDYVHDIDFSVLSADPPLDAALSRLKGRKLVFTNANLSYAETVLARIGIGRHFERIYDIKAGGYIPKPYPEAYGRVVQTLDFDPKRAAMFDDIARNLLPAAAIGIMPVWVRSPGYANWGPGEDGDVSQIQFQTDDLAKWLDDWERSRPAG